MSSLCICVVEKSNPYFEVSPDHRSLQNPVRHLRWSFFYKLRHFDLHLIHSAKFFGKRFSPAGLKDVIIEPGVVEEGLVDEILTGKAYNRKVRFHKLMYKARMRLIWRGFMDWFEEENFPEYQEPDTLLSNINNLSDNDLDSKSFNEILENDV